MEALVWGALVSTALASHPKRHPEVRALARLEGWAAPMVHPSRLATLAPQDDAGALRPCSRSRLIAVASKPPRRERPRCAISDERVDATDALMIHPFAPPATSARALHLPSINAQAAPRRYVAVMNYAAVMKMRRFA